MADKKYEIVQKDNKEAIQICKTESLISQWHEQIDFFGLVAGESNYYKAKNGDTYAIYHKDDPDKPISKNFNVITYFGVISGDSDYYIAGNYIDAMSRKMAIFHKDIPDHPISDWHTWIGFDGLVKGQSDFYAAQDKGMNDISVFYKDEPYKPILQNEDIEQTPPPSIHSSQDTSFLNLQETETYQEMCGPHI